MDNNTNTTIRWAIELAPGFFIGPFRSPRQAKEWAAVPITSTDLRRSIDDGPWEEVR